MFNEDENKPAETEEKPAEGAETATEEGTGPKPANDDTTEAG